jgi:hypothetical protein
MQGPSQLPPQESLSLGVSEIQCFFLMVLLFLLDFVTAEIEYFCYSVVRDICKGGNVK